MGYTHYLRRRRALPERAFAAAAADCKRVCEASGVPLQFEADDPIPAVFTSELIRFNGVGEDGHETFYVGRDFDPEPHQTAERGKYFDFCKTARKPYDLAVCSSLIVLSHHLKKNVAISSDGDDEEENWPKAKLLCQEVLGYGADFTLFRPDPMTMDGLRVGSRWWNGPRCEHILADGWALHTRERRRLVAVTKYHEFQGEYRSKKEALWAATVGWWRDRLEPYPTEDREAFLKNMSQAREWLPLLVLLDQVEEKYGCQVRLRGHLPKKVIQGVST
jgi:hypothetical protein